MPRKKGESVSKEADRISDAVVNLVNDAIKRNVNPLAVLAGLLMGLWSFLRTAPLNDAPPEIASLQSSVLRTLACLVQTMNHVEATSHDTAPTA